MNRGEYLASVALLVLLLITACGGVSTPDTGVTTTSRTTASDPVDEIRPPDLTVTAGSHELTLVPWAYCWHEGDQFVCADGAPPEPLSSVTLETGAELSFRFSLDWHLQASSAISLEAPTEFTQRVIDLGPPPYEVSLTFIIDGQAMAAEILTWPDDYPTYSNESRADVEASS